MRYRPRPTVFFVADSPEDEFLRTWGLYDAAMSPSARLTRYSKFHRVVFGSQVSDVNKRRYMQQLVEFEDWFAEK